MHNFSTKNTEQIPTWTIYVGYRVEFLKKIEKYNMKKELVVRYKNNVD